MDTTKVPKEGKKQVGITVIAQDSSNVKKPAVIVGNEISAVNILLINPESPGHPVAAPVDLHISQGVEEYRKLLPEDQIIQSYGRITEQTFDDLSRIHENFDYEPSLAVLDAYYMKSSFLAEFLEESSIAIVTKARIDTVAFKEPETKKPGTRGPQAKVGEKIKLEQCFGDETLNWQETNIELYGKERRIRFLVQDLLWNRTEHLKLRFVVVEILDREGLRKSRMILVCTDRKIPPEDIIVAYCYRMKIELSFRDMNQQIGLSSYHFWVRPYEY